MSVFEYIALDEKGNQRKGFIDAPGIAAARQKLREENVYPVEINQAAGKKETALSGALRINLWESIYPSTLHSFRLRNATGAFTFHTDATGAKSPF
jgi:type II secretory pathway component PulF